MKCTCPTKRFEIRTILTVTTGRLLTNSKGRNDNGIGDVYELLGWMTNDAPFTHQLPRFADECKPWLLRWFPELKYAAHYLGELKDGNVACDEWLSRVQLLCPALKSHYDVPRIPADDHERRDAYAEMVEMHENDEGIELL